MKTSLAAEKNSIALVQKAIAELKKGRMVILTDDEDRENEGDLVMAAEKVTTESINFMVRHARGLVCLTLTEAKIAELALPQMVTDNTSSRGTAFTVSIEASQGVTTGISAEDRAHTVRVAVKKGALPADLARPGHIFPLKARDGGVLVRPGHTEASVDLARLAGLTPAGVICEVMNDDGTMSRRPQLLKFGKKHGLMVLAIADLITYRLAHERLVRRIGETMVRREPFGDFTAYAFTTDVDAAVHVALVLGDISGNKPVLTRIHRATPVADLLDTMTGEGTLKRAFDIIKREKRGVVLMLQKHVMGIDALSPRTPSNSVVQDGQARLKEVGIGAQILNDLGVSKLRLLTNSKSPIVGVERYGIEVVEQIRLGVG